MVQLVVVTDTLVLQLQLGDNLANKGRKKAWDAWEQIYSKDGSSTNHSPIKKRQQKELENGAQY